MDSSIPGKNAQPRWSVWLVLFTLTAAAVASAQQKKPAAPPAAAPHAAAPSRPAPSAPRSAPAQNPGANANRGMGGGGANANRGMGGPGANTNRGMGAGANANRGAGTYSNPGQAGANRGMGGTGANTNRGMGAGANANRGAGSYSNPGQAGANRGAGANANRGTAGANNRAGGAAGANNRAGGANANRGTVGANNRAGGMNNRAGGANANRAGGANNRAGGMNNRAVGGVNRHQPAGSRQVALRNGGHATFRKDGHVRSIQTAHGMRIEHGVRGGRRVESMHNGRRVVSYGRHGGYSQRAYYSHGGRAYSQRTYYRGGHYYAYGYRNYYYGGHPYYGYAPAYYYRPAYYGWAYNPWPSPVYYNWGWAGQPWYGAYGAYYYQPYPSYPYASLWLTDYVIAANLRAAYEAQQENGALVPPAIANASADEIAALWSTDPLVAAQLRATYGVYMLGGGAPQGGKNVTLTNDLKQAIANQIKNEIAAEKEAAANGQQDAAPGGDQVPAALDPNVLVFVVSSDENLTTSDGDECTLTPGDVVSRASDQPDGDNMVDALVKASKKGECPLDAIVGISVDELQEMHNQLRIQMDDGLKELAAKQGKNGLPAAPDTHTQPGEVPEPTPDKNVASDLEQQQKEADQAEAEAKQPN